MLGVIRQLADEDITMVIVTHEMAFAAEVADRVVFIDGGVIVEQGPAADVLRNPREERTKLFLRELAVEGPPRDDDDGALGRGEGRADGRGDGRGEAPPHVEIPLG